MASPGTAITRIGVHPSNQVGLLSSEFSMAVVPQDSHSYELNSASCGDSSSDAQSPDVPAVKASDREARILAEKHRRSQFNAQIAQMSSLIPDIEHCQRKVDKTSVLRLAANKLRNEHVFGKTIKCPHTEPWSKGILKSCELLGGFLLAVTCKGRIFIVSPNVQDKLGYCHIDLLGQDIYNYIHNDDKETLKQHIYPKELQTGCDPKLFEQHHVFNVRIMRVGAKSDPPRYERCHIDGVLRRSDNATSNGVQEEQTIRRQRVRHHRTFSSSGNDFVFIGIVSVLTNSLPARLALPTAHSEYWTRHLLDGRIVQCDQSISLAVGYMTEEVTGASAFVFMHKEDVRWVICVLRQMYDQSREYGESYYRLMSRTGQFTYMRTRGFLEIDENHKVQSFVCVNSVVEEGYGRKMMEEMKRKYSAIVDIDRSHKENVPAIDEPPVEHPKKLERIVMHLVAPVPSESFEELQFLPPSKENIIAGIENSEKIVYKTGVRFDNRKRKNSSCDTEIECLKKHSVSIDSQN